MRNPVIDFHGVTFKFIGDPHLGRVFTRNVPMSKRGLREKSVELELDANFKEYKDFTVVVGDLFDSFRVTNEILLKARDIILKFIPKKTHIILIPGNHDFCKDKSKMSSYQVLANLLRPYEGEKLTIIERHPKVIYHERIAIYLDAYCPFYGEPKLNVKIEPDTPLISIGHWDDPRFEKGYLPPKELVERSELLVSGHVHIPGTFEKFVFTGSLQPYGHGEDPECTHYKTYTYKEIERIIRSDVLLEQEGVARKNIRINCYPGYYLPVPLNCMALSYNPILDTPEGPTSVEDLDLADFNTSYLLTLKTEHDIEEELLIKIGDFLKNEEITEFKL